MIIILIISFLSLSRHLSAKVGFYTTQTWGKMKIWKDILPKYYPILLRLLHQMDVLLPWGVGVRIYRYVFHICPDIHFLLIINLTFFFLFLGKYVPCMLPDFSIPEIGMFWTPFSCEKWSIKREVRIAIIIII